MGFYATKPATGKTDLTAKNRVWGNFCQPAKTSLENRLQPAELRRKNQPNTTEIASGRSYWPSRDPIQELGGENRYGMVGNDAVNKWDHLGLLPAWLKPLRNKFIKLAGAAAAAAVAKAGCKKMGCCTKWERFKRNWVCCKGLELTLNGIAAAINAAGVSACAAEAAAKGGAVGGPIGGGVGGVIGAGVCGTFAVKLQLAIAAEIAGQFLGCKCP